MQNEHTLQFNGTTAKIRRTADGNFEVSGEEFIDELLRLGFRPGRNDSAEQFAKILGNVPMEHLQDFVDGFLGR